VTIQHVVSDAGIHIPVGDWHVVAPESQSQRLAKVPFTWNIDELHILPLSVAHRKHERIDCREPSVDSYRLVPGEVADYLYDHQEEIPDRWQGSNIVFWSVLQNRESQYYPYGDEFAPALTYSRGSGRWVRLYIPIHSVWAEADMIAVMRD
jgi:hypothetical protein